MGLGYKHTRLHTYANAHILFPQLPLSTHTHAHSTHAADITATYARISRVLHVKINRKCVWMRCTVCVCVERGS